MNFSKTTFTAAALLTGALAMGLLLGVSTVQAQTTVETEEETGNVLRILNLVVDLDPGGTMVYDVDFVNDTGFNVYGANLDQFTFMNFTDATNATAQVLDALNGAIPVPPAASTAGTPEFRIGYKKEGDFFDAAGGDNVQGIAWTVCQSGCDAGREFMKPDQTRTYAVFTVAGSGGPEPTVETDDSGNVLSILNLPITDLGSSPGEDPMITLYDVDFVNGALSTVYPGLGQDFPFNELEEAINAGFQVQDVLNHTFPIPPAASSVGTNQFFVPISETLGTTRSVGSEFLNVEGVGELWDACQTNCQAGQTAQSNSTPLTYLVFSPASGGGPGPEPLVADPGDPYTGTVGVPVTFDGTDSTGNIASYNWDFGDSTTGVGPTVDHLYNVAGTYTVGLTLVEVGSGATAGNSTTADIGTDTPPVAGEVSTVAAEGTPLLDGTVLTQILLDGGVAINRSGKVAFGGRAANDTVPAVFTQDGLVVKEGQTLDDGTIVNDLSPFGEVAISVGQSGDMVAFHGQAETGLNDTDAVFTQAEVVALEGAALGDGTTIVHNIKPEGKVAINDFGEIAFHGKLEVEGDGLDTEEFRAVFTQDGVAVKEGQTLLDGTTIVGNIDETGGVAINLLGLVAFHGEVVAPDAGGDTVPAVFTQDGLVAKEGQTLPDSTIVADIDENGGVAINFLGVVAFHGDVVDAAAGGDTVPAVFTQNGLVVKEGQTLLDGTTIVDEIDQSGGVGIDFSGNVVFHGRTDGVRAVFTQHGLVAKEGDTLTDSTILDEIHATGGVAINLFGQVVFHGKVGTTDVVLLGEAP